nr:gypsy/Ty3 retroelement polyprotein [Tanacetum cinerariifolium]
MTPATRSITTTSNNDEEDMGARLRSVENSLAQVTRALQELNQGMQGRPQNQNQFTRMTKVEFLKFLGDDVKGWIFRCEQFFDIDDSSEHQKVKLIYVHLFDTALLWHKQFIRLNGEAVSWNVYKKGILRRFGTVFDDPVSEMRKIKYQSNAKNYQDAFDTLLSRVDVTTLEAMRKKNKAAMNSQQGRVGGNGSGYESNVKTPLLSLPSPTVNWKTKPNTPATIPKYTPGHKCSGQLFSIVLLADEEWENKEEYMKEENLILDPYCGATHNFLDVNVAKQMGCKKNKTYPLEVAVGGGRKLISNVVCKNFEWQLQGETFYTDMMILPLGGCEMVLGIQWLATFGDIKCNFRKLRMEFMYKEKKITLRDTPKAKIGKLIQKLLLNQKCMGYLVRAYCSISPTRYYKDDSCWSADLKSKTTEDTISNRSFMEVLVLNHYVLVKKVFKCMFGTNQVEYLGHVISAKEVATDPTKINAMQEWPIPSNVKQLKGFLGLTGYYRRFIMNFASVSRPLTQLLKKGGYKWSNEAQAAFDTLKSAMQKASVLALPDFTKPFEVETDTPGVEIGAVLQQNGHPIAYMSKTLSTKHQSLSTYEKEFLAVLLALDK